MPTKQTIHSDPAALDAARWHLLSLLFERPRGGWHDEVTSLAWELADPELRAVAEQAREATEGSYLAVLGPGGVVSPREAGHHKDVDPAQLLSEITTFYKAFAYEPDSENPPDHVAVEAGFIGFMRLKEAYARAAGNPEGEGRTSRAIEKFLARHLREFSRSLAEALEARAPGYLSDTAKCLLRSSSKTTL